jgi:tetratricopeptide (TPR) repeat protein
MSHLPHVQLGLAFHQLNKPRQSIEHFNRALSLKPEDADIMYNLAYTYNIDGIEIMIINGILTKWFRLLGQHSKAADMAHKCTDADHQSVKCLELLSTLLPSTVTAKLYLR